MNVNVVKLNLRQKIAELEANIRWREQIDNFDGIEFLEERLHELKKELESFEI